jgi:hypothetical protein
MATCNECGRDHTAQVGREATMKTREQFDAVIGKLDRCLSEFLDLYEKTLDNPDRQTLKHHADDLIGVGGAMLERLGIEKGKD